MPRYVDLRLKADAAQAVQEFLKLTDAQQKATNELKKMGLEAEKGGKAGKTGFDMMYGSAMTLVGALGFSAGIGAVITKIVEKVAQWRSYMDAIAKVQRTAGETFKPFAIMQPAELMGPRTEEIARLGLGYKIKPEDAVRMAAHFQRRSGTYERALAFARGAFRLQDAAGMPAAEAQQTMQVGLTMGLTAEQATSFAFAGSQAGITPEALEGIRLQMQTARGPMGALWRRVGIRKPGTDPLAQVAALHRAGLTTVQALTRAGVQARRATELAQLVAAWPRISGTAAEAGAVERVGDAAETGVPQIRFAEDLQRLEAQMTFARTFGPIAGRAMRRTVAIRERGLMLEREGHGAEVTPEGEESQSYWDRMTSTSWRSSTGYQVGESLGLWGGRRRLPPRETPSVPGDDAGAAMGVATESLRRVANFFQQAALARSRAPASRGPQ